MFIPERIYLDSGEMYHIREKVAKVSKGLDDTEN